MSVLLIRQPLLILAALLLCRFPFALGFGHFAQLRFAHRLVHSCRSAEDLEIFIRRPHRIALRGNVAHLV
jgi:hypothetical protein